jgi:hypothetical protein
MADALREIAAVFGIEWDEDEMQRGMRSIDGAIGLVQNFASLLAGSVVVSAIRDFAREFEDAAGRIEDTADSLGLTTTQLQELSYAAEQGGVRSEQLSAALATLQRNAVQAAAGNEQLSGAFRQLGINVRDASGHARPVSDLMNDIASAMGRVENPAQRTALAQRLLGESGRRLLTVLHDGEGGLAQFRAELESLGGGISEEAIARAGEYGSQMNRWTVASRSLQSVLATTLLPWLTRLVTGVTTVVGWFVRAQRGTHLVAAGLTALAIAGAGAATRLITAWAPVLLPFLRMSAIIALVVLLIDDLYTLFSGGDSLIGRFLTSLMGIENVRRLGADARDAWGGFRMVLGNVREAWDGLVLAVSRTWDRIRGPLTTVWGWVRRAGSAVSSAYETASGMGALRERAAAAEREAYTTGRLTTSPSDSSYQVNTTRSAREWVQQNTHHDNRTINVNGAGNPDEVARRVMRRLEEQDRERRDAQNPELPRGENAAT